jgi:CheY-like chemotaxis protein
VVDDHTETREVLCRVLTHLGYRSSPAATAAEALVLVEQERPQVLICDILMPGMSGIQLLRELRGRGLVVPAIALSGCASPEEIEGAFAAGFLSHVAKPATIERIEEALMVALAGGSTAPGQVQGPSREVPPQAI